MSDSNTDQQEPSMEEILASIRRIISEDGEEIAYGEDAPEPVEADADNVETEPEAVSEPLMDDGDDDILELTDALDDEIQEVSEPEPEPEREPEPEPEPEPDPEPEPVAEEEPEIEVIDDDVDDDKLVSDEVEEVSVATMSGLTAALAATALVGNGEKTLEELTKELLRPILKEWLDTNLPDMVERIVREEVERIADRAKK